MKFILIADDDVTLTRKMKSILDAELSDVHITCCETLADLFAIEKQNACDVFILNGILPDGDGIDATVTLGHRHPSAAFILMSGDCEVTLPDRIAKMGATVIFKPFESIELIPIIRNGFVKSDPRFLSPTLPTRHYVINCLSRMLSGLRAFETDLRADAGEADLVVAHVDTYVERLADNIHELNDLLKRFPTIQGISNE